MGAAGKKTARSKKVWKRSALLQAARNGDCGKISSLVAAGVVVDFQDAQHGTPLLYAATHGHTDAVGWLIYAGATSHLPYTYDPLEDDRRSRYGAPMTINDRKLPLSAAVREGHKEVVRQLLAAGALVDMMDGDRIPPIWYAASQERVDIVDLLLSAGAQPDRMTLYTKRTPLMEACKNGHQTMAQRLLHAGAKAEHCSGVITNPLLEAVSGGHQEIAELLLEAGARVCLTQLDGQNAVRIAIAHKNIVMLRLLLDTEKWLDDPFAPMYKTILIEAAQTARDCLLALEKSSGLPRDLSRLIWQTAGQRQEYMLPIEGSRREP